MKIAIVGSALILLSAGVCLRFNVGAAEHRLNSPEKRNEILTFKTDSESHTHRRRLQSALPIVNHAASSNRDQKNSGFAVDGLLTSRWDSERTHDQWIYVQLARIYEIDQVKLYWETAFGKKFDIQVSNNTNAWTTVFSQTNGIGGTETINLPAGTSGQYVRMRGIARGTSWGYSIFEFVVMGDPGAGYDPPNAVPVPLKNAQASSVENGSSHNTSKAIDGDNTSRWSSEWSDPQTLTVEVDGARPLYQVDILWQGAYAEEYAIQVSNDAFNWFTVFHETEGDGGRDTFDLPPGTSGRYVRMEGIKRGTSFGYSIFEFVVKGSAVAPAPDALEPLTVVSARASSVETATLYFPVLAIDGDLSTRWSSDRTDSEWLELEFNRTHSIASVELYWETAYGKDFLIQTSSTGSSWNTVFNRTGGEGGIETINLPVNTVGKYLRILGIERGTQWGYSLFQVIARGLANALDVIPSNSVILPIDTVEASSVEAQVPENVPLRAVDGNFTSRWSSNRSDPQWISVSFNKTYTLTQVDLYWEAYGLAYEIQTSTNGTNWTTVFQETNGTGGKEVIDLPSSTTGKFVRMYGTERGTRYGFSLYEFVVWGRT